MARIVYHQIQFPETMAILAIEEPEAEQRRCARSDLRHG
jgi:hypothetical protein